MATIRFEAWHRLEPCWPEQDLQSGFTAEIADAAWILGRQWQLGEHAGEDRASPIHVAYQLSTTAVTPAGSLGHDPATVPLAAVVQQAPDEWWTVGRRVRVGARIAPLLPAALRQDRRLVLTDLPEPYSDCIGGVDGAAVWRHRDEPWLRPLLILDAFDEVPEATGSAWDSERLEYHAQLEVGGAPMDVFCPPPRRAGDWYHASVGPPPVAADAGSAGGASPVGAAGDDAAPTRVVVTRLTYPGAPGPRWWQLEDAAVDIGGSAPDTAHFASALLLHLLLERSDDWYTFPVDLPVGRIAQLHDVRVTDCFGDVWDAAVPEDWSLARPGGEPSNTLLAWPCCPYPLVGPLIERVDVAHDEDANLLIAVESRVLGRDVPTQVASAEATTAPVTAPRTTPATVTPGTRPALRYAPVTGARSRWHPYVLTEAGGRRLFRQARLCDPDAVGADMLPPPTAAVLQGPLSRPHVIDPGAVPATGMTLTRRYVLGRSTNGDPVLWLRYEKGPLEHPISSGLRWDALVAR